MSLTAADLIPNPFAGDSDDDTTLDDSLEGGAYIPEELLLTLTVRDREVVTALCDRPAGREREQFALDALRIGVVAMKHVHNRIDVDLVRSESQRMLGDLQAALAAHAEHAQQRVGTAIKEYLDPTSGRFQERLQSLLKPDGDLPRAIMQLIHGDESHLARTLDQRIGRDSTLMKLLDPEQAQGLLAKLRGAVDGELAKQSKLLLDEFSLNNENSALRRVVGELTAKHGDLSKDLQGKIDEVIKEFSLDKPDSALNKLVGNVERAQRTISSEFSLDNEQSALSRLKSMLTDTQGAINKNLTLDDEASPLARLKRELLELLGRADEKNKSFQEEVKIALAKMVSVREEADRSTRHGATFEDVVCEFVTREAQRVGDVPTSTGATTGLIKNCKVGDFVIELGPDSPAAGAKIVIEAKESMSYNLAAAREELDSARKNRGAQIGVFVFSKKCAPAEQEPFQRFGDDLVVVWDAEDPHTDAFLKAALVTARALAFRTAKQSEAQAADFEAIDRAILAIEKSAGNLSEIKKSAETIRSSSEKIIKRVEIDQSVFEKQLATLREKLDELRSETLTAS